MTPSPRVSALAILAVYWTTLVVGMASCVAIRSDAALVSIWTGTVAGTLLGHALALCNVRARFALLAIVVVAVMGAPYAPAAISGGKLVLAFVPAAACAYWSLGDRTTLVSFWFPVVIWMISILDHSTAAAIPDRTGVVLLGGLAVLFVMFARARETRRVALWSAVATTPLAQPRPSVMLKEHPGPRLARAGWMLLASALAFGAVAWLAPRLWRPESVGGDHPRVAGHHTRLGLPCCPVVDDVDTTRTRVKEYFNIGRGHGETPVTQRPGIDCRRCAAVVASGGTMYVAPRPFEPSNYQPSSYDPWDVPQAEPQLSAASPATAPTAPITPITVEPPPPVAAPVAAPPEVVAAAPPEVVAPSSPVVAQSPVAAPLPPAVAPSPEPVTANTTDPVDEPVAAPATQSPPSLGVPLLRWIAAIVAAAILFQLATLALRPLRRLVTLRHLRRPFWQETVDQRVSNAWQLALVGLRDAGWRASAHESPHDLARRVGVDGAERCATILERARHGIGIDHDDLATMTTSADAAYRDARSRVGRLSRAMTWLRWPLT